MTYHEGRTDARRWVEANKRDAVIILREHHVGGKWVKVFDWEPDDDRLRVGKAVTHVRWDAVNGQVTEERVG